MSSIPPKLRQGENKTKGSNTIMLTSFALKFLGLVNILLRDQGYAINNELQNNCNISSKLFIP